MFFFALIAFGSMVLLVGSYIFGHDGDAGEVSHDGDGHHDGDDATVSVFSLKVLSTFTLGFGIVGAAFRYHGFGYEVASLAGVGSGLVLAGLMYGMLALFYGQQSSSNITFEKLVGQMAVVTGAVNENNVGEVGLSVSGEYGTYLAKSKVGEIGKGKTVKIVDRVAGFLIVEQA